jgi:hypothetical protein
LTVATWGTAGKNDAEFDPEFFRALRKASISGNRASPNAFLNS